jgi:ApaG protein
MFEYKQVSHEISVSVRPIYAEDKSNVLTQKYVFIYTVTIENHGTETVQLLRRSWLIKDSIGDIYEVNGEGVIGKQPIIKPNESFTYQSYCVLKSTSGSMEGMYEMETDNGVSLKISIPRFFLRSHLLN